MLSNRLYEIHEVEYNRNNKLRRDVRLILSSNGQKMMLR